MLVGSGVTAQSFSCDGCIMLFDFQGLHFKFSDSLAVFIIKVEDVQLMDTARLSKTLSQHGSIAHKIKQTENN